MHAFVKKNKMVPSFLLSWKTFPHKPKDLCLNTIIDICKTLLVRVNNLPGVFSQSIERMEILHHHILLLQPSNRNPADWLS